MQTEPFILSGFRYTINTVPKLPFGKFHCFEAKIYNLVTNNNSKYNIKFNTFYNLHKTNEFLCAGGLGNYVLFYSLLYHIKAMTHLHIL